VAYVCVYLLFLDEFYHGIVFTRARTKTITVVGDRFSSHCVDFGLMATAGVIAPAPIDSGLFVARLLSRLTAWRAQGE
jgi:hypothetical protein